MTKPTRQLPSYIEHLEDLEVQRLTELQPAPQSATHLQLDELERNLIAASANGMTLDAYLIWCWQLDQRQTVKSFIVINHVPTVQLEADGTSRLGES